MALWCKPMKLFNHPGIPNPMAQVQTGWLLLGALFFSLTSNAAELPDRVLPAGVGVNIHFARGHERDLDLIAAAGFKFTRMDFSWGGIEREKGIYDWSAYDELTANLDRRGLRAYYIFDYSNPLYEESMVAPEAFSGHVKKVLTSPQHPESDAYFSATDLRNSCPWYSFVVLSIQKGEFHHANCFLPNFEQTEAPKEELIY